MAVSKEILVQYTDLQKERKEVREKIELILKQKEEELKNKEMEEKLKTEKIDITLPSTKIRRGSKAHSVCYL